MLQKLQRYDPMPDIVPSGRQTIKSPFDSVKESLHQKDVCAENKTPSKLHSRPAPDFSKHRFGVRSDKSLDNCSNLLHNCELSDIAQYFMDKKESIYSSRQKKPLGRALSSGIVLPKEVSDPNFRFGLTSEEGEHIDKILFPGTESMFHQRSDFDHLDCDEKDQRQKRFWNVSSIDPKTYRFGAPASGADETAAELLEPKRLLLIGMRRREDHKAAHQHVVGRSTRLSKTTRELSEQAFGLPSKSMKEGQKWGAKECLTGYCLDDGLPNSAQFKPDCSNMMAAGTPSIQSRQKPPRIRSLANTINYGDCPRAQELLYPPKFSSNGITDSDFSDIRDLEDLRQLFNGASMTVTDSEFEEIKGKLGQYSSILLYQKAYNQTKSIL